MMDVGYLIGLIATLAIGHVFSDDSQGGLRERPPWRVASLWDIPCMMNRSDGVVEGYVPDVMELISHQLHQSYSFHVRKDGAYGYPIPDTQTYTGLIGEIIDKKTDLAAAAVSMTGPRKAFIDYTEPLFSVRTIVLINKQPNGSTLSVKDLVDRKVTIATLYNPNVLKMFEDSPLPHLRKIAADQAAMPSLVYKTAYEGVQELRKGGEKFAFVTDSSRGMYFLWRKPCDLIAIETGLPQTEKAFAVGKNSSIKTELDAAISELRESGELVRIRKKWWIDECSRGTLHSWNILIVLPLLVLVHADIVL